MIEERDRSFTAEDFVNVIMASTQGGVHDKLGWFGISDIQQMTQQALSRLLNAGVKAAEPVLVPVGGKAEDIAAILAVIMAGATAVPVSERAHSSTMTHLQSVIKARFSLTSDDRNHRKAPVVVQIATEQPAHRPLLEGAAMIIFTSGSTGAPKGVVLARDRFSAKLHAVRETLAMPDAPTSIVPLQLVFSFGQWATFLPLMLGGTVHLSDKFDTNHIGRLIADQNVTHLAAVPTMLRMLLNGPTSDHAFSILTGGEAVSPDLREKLFRIWPHADVHSIFGLTESGTCDLFRYDKPGVGASHTSHSLGFPPKGISVRTDPENSELLILSPYRMLGYLDMTDVTRSSFTDGWLRTGDVAVIAENGEVWLRGRLKELINRGGNKVSPLEIEALFARHPSIVATLATGVPDTRFGEAIHLLVIPTEDHTLTPEILLDWARPQIDRFKLPDRIHFGLTIPLGGTGKADRMALRREILSGLAT